MTSDIRALRVPVFLALLLAMVALALTAAPQPAEAKAKPTISLICTYMKGCAQKGFSSHGYEGVYKKSHWGAYAGNNCTNYIAYRLNSRGRVTDRPSVIGNASEWGVTIPKTNVAKLVKTPRKGDIAWWSYHRKNPVRSHVAYVEKVYSDGSMLISEDNYGGKFGYKRVYKDHNRYPSGFLRFKQSSGAPTGKVTSAKNSNNTVKIDNFVEEADSPGSYKTQISWGGPRTDKNSLVKSYTSPNNHFGWQRNFAKGQVPKVAYIYVLNSKGKKASDKVMKVNIPGGNMDEGKFSY